MTAENAAPWLITIQRPHCPFSTAMHSARPGELFRCPFCRDAAVAARVRPVHFVFDERSLWPEGQLRAQGRDHFGTCTRCGGSGREPR